MKKMIYSFMVVSLVALLAAGCVPLIIGGAVGVIGGYAASKDTIQGDTDRPYDILWNAAQEVSSMRGTIKKQDEPGGSIEFEANSSHVWIQLVRLTRVTTRLKVSSRKHHFPDLTLAQDIFLKVMEHAQ